MHLHLARRPALALALLAGALAGCGGAAPYATSGGPGAVRVVAAEDFWGSIARQIGGSKASVTSVIADPAVDPHAYEPTAADAIALAQSRLVVVDGIGYDSWASRLLAANPVSGRAVIDVGSLLGLRPGANPHQWYSPASVARVIAAMVGAYQRLDPADSAYFQRGGEAFDKQGLASYHALIAEIRSRFAGVPVGYSESIFEPLGRALGLRMLTPLRFARAIAEGTDVSAADKQTVDSQVQRRQIAVWIYNSQNATPDVARVNELARAAGIPVVTVTETLSPRGATFQQWQDAQLLALREALHRATGR